MFISLHRRSMCDYLSTLFLDDKLKVRKDLSVIGSSDESLFAAVKPNVSNRNNPALVRKRNRAMQTLDG